MLTIFTIPKPFQGNIKTIQRNALRSWTIVQPACEIILCGDAAGVKEASNEFGVRHLSDIALNEFGTPLLSSAFEKVVKLAQFPILCYVNADIMLFDTLLEAIQRIPFRPFIAVGRRTQVNITEPWDFGNAGWRSEILEFVRKNGELGTPKAIDYVLFTPNKQLENLLPFAVGRPCWDNWFIFHARKLKVPVIDLSRTCIVIHQNHDYSHIPFREGKNWGGPEAKNNYDLMVKSMGNSGNLCSILDATHILTTNFLIPSFGISYLIQRWHTSVVLYPSLKPLAVLSKTISRMLRTMMNRLRRVLRRG